MSVYRMNEGAFELPDLGFVDRTVHVFEAALRDERELGLIVCRTRIPDGKSLRDLVAAHVTHEAKRLSGYRILDEAETLRAGAPVIEVRSRWRNDGEPIYQRQAHVAAFDTWLVFAMSVPLDQQALCDDGMERILTSLTLSGDG